MTGSGDFKTGGFMYAVAICVIGVVVIESVFFMVKAWKHGKKLGISKEAMKNTILSSALFSIAPAISILTTVIVLAGALGIVLPWIRLSVIGNLAYETTAAKVTLESLDSALSLSTDITDPKTFGAVAWVMTIGTSFALIILPIFCKTIQTKVGGAMQKNEKTSRLGDIISAAAFIGIIAAFVANAINGRQSMEALTIGDAGFMSVCTLAAAVVLSLILETVCEKFKLSKLEPFAMPISMFGAMGVAVVLNLVLPEAVTAFTWWGTAV